MIKINVSLEHALIFHLENEVKEVNEKEILKKAKENESIHWYETIIDLVLETQSIKREEGMWFGDWGSVDLI